MNNTELADLLTNLLLDEYLQRDVYETYHYHLFGIASPAIQEHLAEHRNQEEAHIKILQRYLMELEVEPVTDRKAIPVIAPPIESILKFNLELEQNAVTNYSRAIRILEEAGGGGGRSTLTALRIDLENILVEEKEHVHDFIQYLR
jgi:bacterioferritin (cytochrome b1)